MNLKSVLLSVPIRVGGAPAAKKYEHGGDIRLVVDPPFVVIGRRTGNVFQSVGVPIVSVVHVEFGDEASTSKASAIDQARALNAAIDAQPQDGERKRKPKPAEAGQ